MNFKDYCTRQSNYFSIRRDILNSLMDKSYSWVQSNIDSIGRNNLSLKVTDNDSSNYLLIKIVDNKYHVRNNKGQVRTFDRFNNLIEAIK